MSWHAGQLPGLLWNEQKSGFWKPEISTPGKLITEALALINPPPQQIYYTSFALWSNKKIRIATWMLLSAL